MSSFTFGNTAQQPGAGFNFGTTAGAAPTSIPAFGAAATSAPAFGAVAAATPAFGAAPAATQTFGAAPAAATAFGVAQPTVAAPAFGTATAAAPAFGVAPAAATVPAFGTPQATAATAFGAASTAAVPAFGATTAATAPTFGLTATSVAAPSFNFGGATATSAAPAFGALGTTTATLAAAPISAVPTLGQGLGGGAFSFNKPAATTTSASLNFGTTTTTATPFSAGAASGIWKPAATTTTTAASTPFVGLGGIDVSATQPKAGDLKQDSVKIKETQVPDEIAKTVDALKSHIKAQKTLSSDIGRTSTSKLSNVSHGISNLQWALQEISNSVDANYKQIKLLRKETSKTIQSVEMAQRTQDTPAGLQFENTAPFQFFQSLVGKYEEDLINFRQQIALTEHHMRSLTNPQPVSPEDLKRGFRQINESFISLAGRLHELHQKVEAQKEQFLNLRKYRLRDTTNVFAELDNPMPKVDNARITCGPTPFSNISAMSVFGKSFSNATAGGAAGGSGTAPSGAK